MEELNALCQSCGAQLNLDYWRYITERLLSTIDCTTPIIVPSQAGSGKSTWILAFILTLCEHLLGGSPFSAELGGIILVVQKVEDLETISDLIKARFPQATAPLMTPMQSLGDNAIRRGYCLDAQVRDYLDCHPKDCTYFADCPLQTMRTNAHRSLVVEMTQSRYHTLVDSGELQWYLNREEGGMPRRFLITDEKPQLYSSVTVNMHTVNKASSELEQATKYLYDGQVAKLQRQFSIFVTRVFQQLRLPFSQPLTPTSPLACVSLALEEGQQQGLRDLELVCGEKLTHQTPSISDCFRAMRQGHGAPVFIQRHNGFAVTVPLKVSAAFAGIIRVIFDATACVDGDYVHFPCQMLDELPISPMPQLHFHIYRDPSMNLSKRAVRTKAWLPDALALLIDDILERHPAPAFLCTYKEQSKGIYDALSPKSKERIALMTPNAENLPIPYFGGTNGSNAFNYCQTVLLLGYPRLPPEEYLRQTYLAWRQAGFEEEIADLMTQYHAAATPKEASAYLQSPLAKEYEARHLAARYEQELYRSALRNSGESKPVHVFLFAPPKGVEAYLLPRFPACQVVEETVPITFLVKQNHARSYQGASTAMAKLAEFLVTWDGKPIAISKMRQVLDISTDAWGSLRKTQHFKEFCNVHGLQFQGHGRSATMFQLPYFS
ncbi:hypothetical protein RFF05_12570 [Bengtsoniella intestinalis]|uniref:hypothetical protein n=1 Tax=Bengtsoniella intestinalis TaxID=3073143 RepID=UPI00391FB1F4